MEQSQEAQAPAPAAARPGGTRAIVGAAVAIVGVIDCHRALPGNDVVAAFPFARRIPHDPARLRYWVVCTRYGKWTLAPLEDDERAVVIDHFERWWRGSSAHYTTGGISLGRYSPGFSVVRIGDAGWNEFASWRYAPTGGGTCGTCRGAA